MAARRDRWSSWASFCSAPARLTLRGIVKLSEVGVVANHISLMRHI